MAKVAGGVDFARWLPGGAGMGSISGSSGKPGRVGLPAEDGDLERHEDDGGFQNQGDGECGGALPGDVGTTGRGDAGIRAGEMKEYEGERARIG